MRAIPQTGFKQSFILYFYTVIIDTTDLQRHRKRVDFVNGCSHRSYPVVCYVEGNVEVHLQILPSHILHEGGKMIETHCSFLYLTLTFMLFGFFYLVFPQIHRSKYFEIVSVLGHIDPKTHV